MQEGAARLDCPVDLCQVMIVNAGNHHRIHLAENAALGQHLQAQQLALAQNPGRFHSLVPSLVEIDPGIDLRANLRIDHVNGDRHMIDLERLDSIDVFGEHKSVRRKTKLDVGSSLGHKLEGLKGSSRD